MTRELLPARLAGHVSSKLVVTQAMVVAVIAMGCSLVSLDYAISALAGGLVIVIPNHLTRIAMERTDQGIWIVMIAMTRLALMGMLLFLSVLWFMTEPFLFFGTVFIAWLVPPYMFVFGKASKERDDI